MPDQAFEGHVKFRALVQRANRQSWEEATSIEVNINRNQTSSSTRRTEDTSVRSEVDSETTRWSHGGEVHPATETAQIFRESLSNVTESYERLEAEQGGWDQARNGAENGPMLETLSALIYLIISNNKQL